jgi:putative GTP pyrophosphokinase
MDQDEFKKRYQLDMETYLAWGRFVSATVRQKLLEKLKSKDALDTFLKIPSVPRLKTTDSLISKAFARGKRYANPYEDITDKVGVRFVVLLIKDIDIISEIIETTDAWRASKDRDFEEERQNNPIQFIYQSKHYIVVSNKKTIKDDVEIPAGIPCEVQVRTLLQHAYSELTHDTTYKPKAKVTPTVMRAIAKSMALIETTDGFFQQVSDEFDEIERSTKDRFDSVVKLYKSYVDTAVDFEAKYNAVVLDSIADLVGEVDDEEIVSFIDGNKFLIDTIKRKYGHDFIYRQPVIFLLYYLIAKMPYNLKGAWQLPDADIIPLFTDLGVSW